MSENTRRIKVEFGPFRVVLEGFARSSEGIDLTLQLIRSLSAQKLVSGLSDRRSVPRDEDPDDFAGDRHAPETPLLLQEDAPADLPAESQPVKTAARPPEPTDGPPPEFRTVRRDLAAQRAAQQAAQTPPVRPRPWQDDIERLEASARVAVAALARAQQAARASATAADRDDETEDDSDTSASHADPAAPADGFQPHAVANSDNWPNEAAGPPYADGYDPKPETDRIGHDLGYGGADGPSQTFPDETGFDGGPADTGAQVKVRSQLNGAAHDYLAMEDEAIDRLLETTNALLETDDHTRKSQSIGRQKAAVLATEAERRIKVRTKSGTVTLDFDDDGGTRHPVADLLAAPRIDAEQRRERLQAYRKMISEHKKRS